MNDERTLEQRVAWGAEARRILESEVMNAALEAAKAEMVRDWLATKDEREQWLAWAKVHAMGEVMAQLRRLLADGEHAAEALRRAQ